MRRILMNNKRIHNVRIENADQPFIFDPTKKYEQPPPQGMKPRGLWYGIDLAWIKWCESEEPHWISDQYFELHLGDSNVLSMKDSLEIIDFAKRYGCELFPDSDARLRMYSKGIDWKKVATEFDGIEIAPYCWSLRTEPGFLWYYGWDCASGCIWNLEKVTVEQIPNPRLKTERAIDLE